MSIGNSNGFVRVMRSHDYNQFEVCLPLVDPGPNYRSPDELRKVAARLVDKAVRQYDQMKRVTEMVNRLRGDNEAGLRLEVADIMTVPAERWSPEQKAKVTLLSNYDHHAKRMAQFKDYTYEDDEPEFEDDPSF